MVSGRRSLDAARKVLVERFGHEEFQEGQWESIEALLAGRDALVVMPTGSGKSLVYQLPALMLPGLTVIVSSTSSKTAVSLLILSFLVPAVLFSAVAGVYVDRVDRRIILVASGDDQDCDKRQHSPGRTLGPARRLDGFRRRLPRGPHVGSIGAFPRTL